MSRYPWFPLWIDDLTTSTNWNSIKWATQGIYVNVLRWVRREPELAGLIVHSNGAAIEIPELARSIDKGHPERVRIHLDRLFAVGLLEMDGERIRVSRFREKLAAALKITRHQNGPITGAETGAETGNNPVSFPSCSRSVPETGVLYSVRAPESESESDKTEQQPSSAKADGRALPSDFVAFWEAYPRKIGKAAALRAWCRVNGHRPPLSDILAALVRAKASDQWRKDGGEYIPHPTTWINQGRWDDEVAPSRQAGLSVEELNRALAESKK